TLELYLLLERNFCTGKQAHCHVWFSHGGKTARDRVVELCRYEFVSDLCGSGRNMVQTVVAHRWNSLPGTAEMVVFVGEGSQTPVAILCLSRHSGSTKKILLDLLSRGSRRLMFPHGGGRGHFRPPLRNQDN